MVVPQANLKVFNDSSPKLSLEISDKFIRLLGHSSVRLSPPVIYLNFC